MLKSFKSNWKALSNFGKVAYFYCFSLILVNTYGIYKGIQADDYSIVVSHLIYTVTLVATFVVLGVSVRYFEQGKKMFQEANDLYGKGHEDHRMAMYEKLLEKNEKEIQ